MSPGRPRRRHAAPGTFGDLLLRLREKQRLTPSQLAEKSGIRREYITQLETGHCLPSPRAVRLLAGALDIHPLKLKLATGQLEFWDLYPANLEERPVGHDLAHITREEEIQLLWFLVYLRSVPA